MKEGSDDCKPIYIYPHNGVGPATSNNIYRAMIRVISFMSYNALSLSDINISFIIIKTHFLTRVTVHSPFDEVLDLIVNAGHPLLCFGRPHLLTSISFNIY